MLFFFKLRVLKEKRRFDGGPEMRHIGAKTFCDAVGFASNRSPILNSFGILINGTI